MQATRSESLRTNKGRIRPPRPRQKGKTMTARDALSKIQFQLVEAQGNMSGMSVAIDRQADRIIKELAAAGYEIVCKHPK